MNKILILYTSKYGSTERYATLMRDALEQRSDTEVTLSPLDKFKGDVRSYDTIVYGAGIKAYEMYGIKKFTRLIRKVDIVSTLVLVFAVGMMSGSVAYARRLVEKNNIASDIKFFYLRGAIDLAKLKGFDASIVKHLVSSLMLRDDLTEDEKVFVSACLNGKDWVSRDNIMKVVEYI